MIDTLAPGKSIRCTITRVPVTPDANDTLLRLMREDPEIKRALRKTQRRRHQNQDIYNRGNRDWHNRPKVAKLAKVEEGASWTMTFYPQIAPDLRSVEAFMTIAAA